MSTSWENAYPGEPGEPRHPDAYEYGEEWGPDNPAPGSAWDREPPPILLSEPPSIPRNCACKWTAVDGGDWHKTPGDRPCPVHGAVTGEERS